MKFFKYHALGNIYAVVPAGARLTTQQIQTFCHYQYGVGTDGILVPEQQDEEGRFPVRIFNPDGSEAETSGNGLRIFVRWLVDEGLVEGKCVVVCPAGARHATIHPNNQITMSMGQATFPTHPPTLTIANQTLLYTAVNIGNPHCVIRQTHISAQETRALGPLIEHHPHFPNRTNVQFMQILDPHNIRIEIWERGAGYTLASGSSSCASAAVAMRLGHCQSPMTVHMPGGQLTVALTSDFYLTLTGSTTKIRDGNWSVAQTE